MTALLPARVRRDRIVALLDDAEFLRVTDLAERFDVSEVTVRADLDALGARGLLRRVRGGAVPRPSNPAERAFEEAEVAARPQKDAIAKAAAGLVRSGDTVILDVGTTTTAVAEALAERRDLSDVTAFTNSLSIALALEPAAEWLTVVVTGGTLRPKQHSLVEPLAGFILNTIHANLVFLGCNGIDIEVGITNVNLPETQVKKMMLAAAQRRVVCADSSKIGIVALADVCAVEDIDLLVTDDTGDPALIAELRETGLQVTTAAVT